MKLDDLRSILLSERETGRLTAVAPDIFEKGHAELAAITKKVYAFEDPFSDEARSLIDETLSIRETHPGPVCDPFPQDPRPHDHACGRQLL